MPRRIGVLGGSFNPVHIGHLVMAQDVLEAFELSKVIFLPCATPPHKQNSTLAAPTHRLAMLQAAIERCTSFEISDVELLRGGTSYTIDSVRELRKSYPKSEIYFIIGSDSLTELHSWKDIGTLMTLCRIITVARPGFAVNRITREDLNLSETQTEKLISNIISVHQIDVSASDIRHRVAEGMRVSFLIPHAVEIYIAEHRLYSCR